MVEAAIKPHLFADFRLDESSSLPRFRQLKRFIVQQLHKGQLSSGVMPSTRSLASELGVSRKVVMQCYEELLAEGYFCQDWRHQFKISPTVAVAARSTDNLKEAAHLFEEQRGASGSELKSFLNLGGATNSMSLELRQALATHLRLTRGLNCEVDQIFVTSSFRLSLMLIHLLAGSSAQIIVDNPGGHPVHSVMSALCAHIDHVNLSDARAVHQLRIDSAPALIFSCATHQHPLGDKLPRQMQQLLLQIADRTDGFVVDLDLYHDLVPGPQVVFEMPSERLIRLYQIGATTLADAISCLVVPSALRSRVDALYKALHLFPPLPVQEQYCALLSGKLQRSMRNMQRTAAANRRLLINHLIRGLPSNCYLDAEPNASWLLIRMPMHNDDNAPAQALSDSGLPVLSLSSFYDHNPLERGLLIPLWVSIDNLAEQCTTILRQLHQETQRSRSAVAEIDQANSFANESTLPHATGLAGLLR